MQLIFQFKLNIFFSPSEFIITNNKLVFFVVENVQPLYFAARIFFREEQMLVENKMKTEVSVAATFISGLLSRSSSSVSLTGDQLKLFTHTLTEALIEHYRQHWFPHAPCRGSGYRCLRINRKMDPLIEKAASAVGLAQEQLFSSLPLELTLWVDPSEVSYRIGEDGSTCVLYKSSPLQPKSASSADSSAHRKEKLITTQSKC